MPLSLRLDLDSHYVADFPMAAALVLDNRDPDSGYEGLPYIDPQTPSGAVVLEIEAEGRPAVRLPKHEAGRFTEMLGLAVEPMQRMRYHVDLLHWTRWMPGDYRVRAHFLTPDSEVSSDEAHVHVRAPEREDLLAIRALLGRHFVRPDAWNEFVALERRAPSLGPVSPACTRATSHPLFLHRATHGPTAVADLNATPLDAFGSGPLQVEAAALRYEILVARVDPQRAAARAQILSRWPGLEWRLDEADAGDGLLPSLRAMYGAGAVNPGG